MTERLLVKIVREQRGKDERYPNSVEESIELSVELSEESRERVFNAIVGALLPPAPKTILSPFLPQSAELK